MENKKVVNIDMRQYGMVLALIAVYVIFAILTGGKNMSPANINNLIMQNGYIVILAVGMLLCVLTGNVDLGVGSIVATCGAVIGIGMVDYGWNMWVAILAALVVALLCGMFAGFFIAELGIPPFIVTLAGMFFARGMTTIVNTAPFNVSNEAFVALKNTRIIVPGMGSVNRLGNYVDAYVEIGVIVAILVVIVMFCVLKWTKLGRNFYAVGGNSQSALMLGINVKRTKFIAHLLCGVLAGTGGFVYFLHVGSGSPSHASGAEMNAIASSTIRGTMLTGGVGNIIGTFFGVLSLSTIQNIVSSAGLDQAWWTGITVAAMLCLFLVVQSVVMAVRKKGSVK